MDLQEKLEAAEKKANALLEELNAVERSLSQLSPADPQRVSLKAQKADILARYQGSKSHVKELRRQTNSVAPAPSPFRTRKEEDRRITKRLYENLAILLDAYREKGSKGKVALTEDMVDSFEEFLDFHETE